MELLKEKIPRQIFQILERVQISSLEYFLLKSKQEICNETKLSTLDVNKLVNIVSEINLNDIVTASELKSWPVLNTGCLIIDNTIKGIPTRGITEIYGESGTGKTQFCLNLLLETLKPKGNYGDFNSGAAYISTIGNFPSTRLQELITRFPYENRKSITDSIYLEHIHEIDKLKSCIDIQIPVLLSKTKLKLIIIDSITAVFRYNDESKDYITRAEDLRFLATKLNKLSFDHNIAIVCINQVTADPNIGIKPCLGLTWSNLVRKRIKFTSLGTTILKKNEPLRVRKMKVMFSPDVARNECKFVITKAGVTGIIQ